MVPLCGQAPGASALLEELLIDTDMQIGRYDRGEIWLNGSRAIAFVLLGRPREAIAMLQRQAQLGFLSHLWQIELEYEPAFGSLGGRIFVR